MFEIDPATLDTMRIDGYQVALADLGDTPEPPRVISLAGNPFVFYRSFLRKGYAAILPRHIEQLLAQGKDRILIGQRHDRLYLYTLQS